ncbi:LysR family transcriptional regulator [Streptomyces profundus]|nr:LysR family transcriptional regulator [Streptomyces sp. MA3_2.13]
MLRAVHQHGTVTAAAAALHLTPSAVSHHLRELAKELRVRLVEPQGRRIRLTGAAHLVIEHGDRLLAGWEEAESALESYRAGEAGLLRMCGFPSAVANLITPAVALLARTHPGLRVQVAECETVDGFDMLMSTHADIALLAPSADFPDQGDARFDQLPLVDDPLDLMVGADHPLATRSSVALEELADEDWVLPAPGTCDHHQRVLVFCAVAGFTPRVVHSVKEWYAISSLISHGLGISLFPRLAEFPPSHRVVRVPIAGERGLARRILSCVRSGSRAHPLVRHGLAALEEAVAAHPLLAGTAPDLRPARPAPGHVRIA